MSLVLVVTIGVLYGLGAYLLQQRTLTRMIIGIILLGHGANLLLLASGGGPGIVPLVGAFDEPGDAADPLPQALALTAIVISFGVTAFLLALAYRSWQLRSNDEVEDDLEDRRIAEQERYGEDPNAIGVDPEIAADVAARAPEVSGESSDLRGTSPPEGGSEP